jgi:hypothetical protein
MINKKEEKDKSLVAKFQLLRIVILNPNKKKRTIYIN